MCIQHACPALRTRPTPTWNIDLITHKTKTMRFRGAGEWIKVGSDWRRSSHHFFEFERTHLVCQHTLNTALPHDALAVQLAFVQEHTQKTHIVLRGRVQAVAHAIHFGIRRWRQGEITKLTILAARLNASESGLHMRTYLDISVVHAERLE